MPAQTTTPSMQADNRVFNATAIDMGELTTYARAGTRLQRNIKVLFHRLIEPERGGFVTCRTHHRELAICVRAHPTLRRHPSFKLRKCNERRSTERYCGRVRNGCMQTRRREYLRIRHPPWYRMIVARIT